MLIGRTREREAIDQLLAGARAGASGVLVLRGAAGIGKSELLKYAASNAPEFTVSRVVGVESEIAIGFAAIHQLLLPFLDRAHDLPEPQRHALESVFGFSHHGVPNSLLVFLAVLTLLDLAAHDRPVLLVVDDAQWLDEESARILTFVARRLHAEPIAMLCGVRDIPASRAEVFGSLPALDVAALDESDTRALLEQLVGGAVEPRVADQLVEQAEGNPLAIVEIVAQLNPQQLSGAAPLPNPLPVGRSLQDAFGARARRLPADGYTLLLLASAERIGDPALLHRAAAAMGVSWEEAVESIEAAGLATFAPTVQFRHPLIRSAAYHGAGPAERRHAHQALADALDGREEADRRAWHLAAAATAPDEEVAQALEDAAERLFARGGTQAASDFLLRASALTPSPVRRVDRLLEAVRLQAAVGGSTRAQPLLDDVFGQVHDLHQRAQAEWTQGLISLGAGQARDALRALARAVGSIERYESTFPLDALIVAEDAALYVGTLSEASLVEGVAAAATRLLPEVGPHTPTEILVRGVAIALTDGYVAAAPLLRDALAGLRHQGEHNAPIMTSLAHERANMLHLLLINVAAAMLDDEVFDLATRSWMAFGRRTQTLTTLPIALDLRAVYETLAGRFREADAVIAEGEEILSVIGTRGHVGEPGLGQLILMAHRGENEKTHATAARRSRDARGRGCGIDLDHSDYALAILEIGCGNYPAALEHCRAIFDRDPFPTSTLTMPLLVEAAARCNDLLTAREAFARLSERANAAGSEWALGLLSSASALLADDDSAEKCYEVALDHFSRSSAAFDRARVCLLYGEWLRRVRRRRDAREPLRAALESFEEMGALAFAERARRELTATGEHSRPRSDSTRDLLTPQESHIASLVAAGRTNPEIASELFISRSTVEYHLRKIYRKLGVKTRTQLARHQLAR